MLHFEMFGGFDGVLVSPKVTWHSPLRSVAVLTSIWTTAMTMSKVFAMTVWILMVKMTSTCTTPLAVKR